jgi:hypothetical protein
VKPVPDRQAVIRVHAENSGQTWVCQVGVEHGRQRTQHVVTVTPADLARWGGGTEQEDIEELVARSFEFLLEREPADSILATFDLSVIQRYFPEYDGIFTRP